MSEQQHDATAVRLRYDPQPPPEEAAGALTLTFPTDAERGAAPFEATLARPGAVREALQTLGAVLDSDLRRKASDRSDYLAYLLAQGKKATKELWEAQKAFLDAQYGDEEEDAEGPLDPVLTVDERGVALEVFSADESSYARLHLKPEAFAEGQRPSGPARTTHLRLDAPAREALGRIRAYRETRLRFLPSEGGEARERRVPHRWARALSQVQAASTLPGARFEIAPVDLYNVLLTLRLHRAKTSPRALRYELVSGRAPRLVLEPWERVLEGTGPAYEGDRPAVVRTWGRRRLAALARLLPHTERVTVQLVGAGLPAYYVLDLGDATLTLALSGWTDSGWAGIATFDLLVGGGADDVLAQRVLQLAQAAPRSLAELEAETGRARGELRAAILVLMQRGQLLHDVAADRFVARPLFAQPLDEAALRYRDAREEEAHRLLATEGAVRLTRVHDLGGEGVRIEGEVEDAQAHRVYQTSFTLDREGRTVDAQCTSPQFRRSGLREGPTVPMIALRLRYAREKARLEEARKTPEGRKLIRAETRTLVRRERGGSTTLRVTLDDRRVIVRQGPGAEVARVQRLFFADADAARAEYFRRLERSAAKGFIDASAGEVA